MSGLPKEEWLLREEIRAVRGEDFYCAEIALAGRATVAMIQSSQHCPPRGLTHDETRAMAHMMVAAPEMYEALKEVRRWLMDPFEAKDADDENLHPAFRNALKATIAALAKASGRPE